MPYELALPGEPGFAPIPLDVAYDLAMELVTEYRRGLVDHACTLSQFTTGHQMLVNLRGNDVEIRDTIRSLAEQQPSFWLARVEIALATLLNALWREQPELEEGRKIRESGMHGDPVRAN